MTLIPDREMDSTSPGLISASIVQKLAKSELSIVDITGKMLMFY